MRLQKIIRVVADQQGRELIEVGQEAGAEAICGTSLKAVLDRDWDQPGQREDALNLVLNVLQAMESWVQTLQPDEVELAEPSLEIAQQIKEQDVQVDENGKASLIKGVAKDRRISVEDSEMRHGRKSRSVLVDGTNAMSCMIWTRVSSVRWESRQPMSLKPVSLEPSVKISVSKKFV